MRDAGMKAVEAEPTLKGEAKLGDVCPPNHLFAPGPFSRPLCVFFLKIAFIA